MDCTNPVSRLKRAAWSAAHLGAMLTLAVAFATACGPEFLEQDTDGDGLVNSSDLCPTVVEEPNGHEDEDGCPDEAPPKPVPDPEPLDLRMHGAWYGVASFEPERMAPILYGSHETKLQCGRIVVQPMREHDAMLELPCAAAVQPVVHAQGFGRSLTFASSGGVTADLSGPPECRRSLAYIGGTVRLDEDGHMRMEATGAYSDCNVSGVPTIITFDGALR